MKNKIISIVLIAIFLTLTLPIVSSAGRETRLTWDISSATGTPTIYGNKVVWSYGNGIDVYDVKTGKYTTINMPTNYTGDPAIHGDKIVWSLFDTYNGSYDGLCVYDIPTSASSLITDNVSSGISDIYGNIIVWSHQDHQDSAYNTNIYMYDISTHRQTPINTSGEAIDPAIYGNKIVWMEYGRNGRYTDNNGNTYTRSDIYMYDLSTKEETRITTSGRASLPDIYGNRIVWIDKRNTDYLGGKGNIYMYDLLTQQETPITTDGSAFEPAINGNRIVWKDFDNGCIYMYDLFTKKKTQITTSGTAVDPSIYENIIVYGDYRSAPPGDSYRDVYMYDLDAKPIKPQAAFTAERTSGKAPLTVYFTDKSTGGTPTSYYWDFGDKTTSKHAYAKHTFTKSGKYTVSLTVKNTEGSSTAKKTDYVIVTK